MASFGYSSSPVLALTPQPAHQNPLDRLCHKLQRPSYHHSVSWPQQQQQRARTNSLAGRKRSRDEAAVNLDSAEKLVETPIIKESEDEWEYGPGMVLIKKNSRYVVDASSQSGTWVEEKAAEEEARKAEEARLQLSQERPSLRSSKSQRLDTPAAPASPDSARDNCQGPSSPGPAQPIVDDFTVHLGIGWSRISDDEHIQAAARGWARYIENHFPVTDAKIRLESRGLQSYLVEANEGFFLFAENLRQGRLVSSVAERAIHNLKSCPILFDGAATMDATESPQPAFITPHNDNTTPISVPPTVEMDMS